MVTAREGHLAIVKILINHGANVNDKNMAGKFFPVWLQNQLISTGLEPVLSHTEKSCIVLYYIQFSMNIKMYNHNIKTFFY